MYGIIMRARVIRTVARTDIAPFKSRHLLDRDRRGLKDLLNRHRLAFSTFAFPLPALLALLPALAFPGVTLLSVTSLDNVNNLLLQVRMRAVGVLACSAEELAAPTPELRA